ncbi:hypothetical protein DPEC_G00086520, partial [Dallia pectoralis]
MSRFIGEAFAQTNMYGPAPGSAPAPHPSLQSGHSVASFVQPSSVGTAGSDSFYWLSPAHASYPVAGTCPPRRTCHASRP